MPTFPAHPGADEGDTGPAAERVSSSAATAATASAAATAIATRSRLCADRHVDAMVVLFDRIDPGAQRDLAAGRLIPLPHLPSVWLFVVVEHESALREQRVMQPFDGSDVLLAGGAEAEDAAA